MRPRLLLALAAAVLAAALGAAPAEAQRDRTVKAQILGVNDLHGHLERTTPGRVTPAAGQEAVPAGGVEFLATHLRRLAREEEHSLTMSVGDAVGGSPLLSALFHDEPTVEAMNLMDFEANVVGNHEFDEGVAELRRIVRGGCHPEDGCQDETPYRGADFPFLAANVVQEGTERTLFRPYVIRRVDGVKIGFVGVVLEDTPTIVSPSGVAGLEFRDEADTINRNVRRLRRAGVQAIVALVHQGGQQGRPGGINDCNELTGPIADIAKRVSREVDVIMSAHTHQAYICRDGRRVITQGLSFGRLITDIDLTLERRTGEVASVKATNRIVTQDVPAASDMTRLIARYDRVAAPLRDRVIGRVAAPLSRAAAPSGESVLGNVIADAQLAATSAPERGGAQVAFMNPGGIRADLDAGEVTYGEAFTVQPFANSLVTLTLTGKQIDTLLEQQWCGQDPTRPRILQVSAGFAYTWDETRPVCDRVLDETITIAGAPVDPAGSYRVTVNSFLAEGGDAFAVLREGTARLGGDVDLDAFEAYLTANGGGEGLPAPALGRITRIP